MRGILSLRGLPIFSAFFLWSFGTGAINLARPLFASSFGVPVVMVTLISTTNSASSFISGPLTGYLMDRVGRRPLFLVGLAIRTVSLLAEFYADSYLTYILLEFFGSLGVQVWVTGSNILVADLTEDTNRGRAVALRTMSSRLGFVLGPLVGGLIAAAFGLHAVFLFSGFTKIPIMLTFWLLIGETRPEAAAPPRGTPIGDREKLPLNIFLTRAFLMISLVTFTVAMMAQGVFQSLFPLSLKETGAFRTDEIGTLITIASLATLLVSYPNGMLVDRFGRKSTLVPGLALYGAASALLAVGGDYGRIVFVVILYGIGQSVCQGVSQVYAMDLAPENRRGAFLGIWSLLTTLGTAAAPLAVGFTAERFGYGFTFVVVGIALGVVALAMWALGPDTGPRTQRARVLAAS